MYSIVLEDNSNSLRYSIYTLIITTYRMNKRGFDCALSRATSRAVFSPIFYFSISFFSPLFSPPYYPGFSWALSPYRIHPAYQSFYYTTTPRDSVELYPPKTNFYSTGLVGMPKNYHNNLLIHLFNACYMLHACTKTSIAFASPWRIKVEEMIYFFLTIASTWDVPRDSFLINYINTMSSINFFKLRKILADHDQ